MDVKAEWYHHGERNYQIFFKRGDGQQLIAYGENPSKVEERLIEICNFEFGEGKYSLDIHYNRTEEANA